MKKDDLRLSRAFTEAPSELHDAVESAFQRGERARAFILGDMKLQMMRQSVLRCRAGRVEGSYKELNCIFLACRQRVGLWRELGNQN